MYDYDLTLRHLKNSKGAFASFEKEDLQQKIYAFIFYTPCES